MKNPLNDDDMKLFVDSYEQELKQRPIIFTAKFLIMLMIGYFLIFSIELTASLIIFSMTTFIILEDFSLLIPTMPYLVGYTLLGCNPFTKYLSPKGYKITVHNFPLLSDELDNFKQKQKIPRIDKVIIEPSCNAHVHLEPQFLYLGWYKRTISIGMDLMLITSPEQMRSVLAHELEHLNNKNNKLGIRAYIIIRHIKFYIFLLEKCNLNKLANGLINYVGILAVYRIVSNRQAEFLADATSAKLTDKKHTTEGLLNQYIYADWLEESYWQPLFDLSRILPKPPESAYSDLQNYLQMYRFSKDDLESRTKQALLKKTDTLDSHPSLKERLAAFNTIPEISMLPETSAAQVWFGEKLDSVITEMDKHWQETYATYWQTLHLKHQKEQSS